MGHLIGGRLEQFAPGMDGRAGRQDRAVEQEQGRGIAHQRRGRHRLDPAHEAGGIGLPGMAEDRSDLQRIKRIKLPDLQLAQTCAEEPRFGRWQGDGPAGDAPPGVGRVAQCVGQIAQAVAAGLPDPKFLQGVDEHDLASRARAVHELARRDDAGPSVGGRLGKGRRLAAARLAQQDQPRQVGQFADDSNALGLQALATLRHLSIDAGERFAETWHRTSRSPGGRARDPPLACRLAIIAERRRYDCLRL